MAWEPYPDRLAPRDPGKQPPVVPFTELICGLASAGWSGEALAAGQRRHAFDDALHIPFVQEGMHR